MQAGPEPGCSELIEGTWPQREGSAKPCVVHVWHALQAMCGLTCPASQVWCAPVWRTLQARPSDAIVASIQATRERYSGWLVDV